MAYVRGGGLGGHQRALPPRSCARRNPARQEDLGYVMVQSEQARRVLRCRRRQPLIAPLAKSADPAMQDMPSEIRIEETVTAFLPVLTTEMTTWLASSTASLFRALNSGGIDARVCESLQEVVVFVARFTPSDILLADGRQRASFTYCQLSKELGLDADSTQTVQHALHALSLSPKPCDPYNYRLASDLISRE